MKNVFYDSARLEKFIGKSLAFNEVHKIRDLSYNAIRARRCNFGTVCIGIVFSLLMNAFPRKELLQWELMNILSYKLNYLVFAAGCAELKLLLFNSTSGFLFIFLCWLLLAIALRILWNLCYFSNCWYLFHFRRENMTVFRTRLLPIFSSKRSFITALIIKMKDR